MYRRGACCRYRYVCRRILLYLSGNFFSVFSFFFLWLIYVVFKISIYAYKFWKSHSGGCCRLPSQYRRGYHYIMMVTISDIEHNSKSKKQVTRRTALFCLPFVCRQVAENARLFVSGDVKGFSKLLRRGYNVLFIHYVRLSFEAVSPPCLTPSSLVNMYNKITYCEKKKNNYRLYGKSCIYISYVIILCITVKRTESISYM